MPERMPAVFIGPGDPMNALLENVHTAAWRAVGALDSLRLTRSYSAR